MDDLPKDLQHDWIRFVDGRPSREEITDWIAVKAAEIGWNWMDLSEALFLGVKKPAYLYSYGLTRWVKRPGSRMLGDLEDRRAVRRG